MALGNKRAVLKVVSLVKIIGRIYGGGGWCRTDQGNLPPQALVNYLVWIMTHVLHGYRLFGI